MATAMNIAIAAAAPAPGQLALLLQPHEHRDDERERQDVLDGLEPPQELAERSRPARSRDGIRRNRTRGGHHDDERPPDPQRQAESG